MKLNFVVGARPQFIKLAPVLAAVNRTPGVEAKVIHTGQHYSDSMSQVFFDELGMPAPDVNLHIHGGTHGAMTGQMMIGLEPIWLEDRPDALVIFGDTNSTLAAAIVGSKLNLPMAHIEAGLRMYDLSIPEEVNRRVSDHLCGLNFTPTPQATANLKLEGLDASIREVGDVMLDASLHFREKALACDVMSRLGLSDGEYLLLTIHRADHTSNRESLQSRIDFARNTAGGKEVVFPVHPRTRGAIAEFGCDVSGMRLVEPEGYLAFMRLLLGCDQVVTDSGGVQKEAYFVRRPCTTLRGDRTEWVETIEAGWNRLWNQPEWNTPRRDIPEYGDGHSSEKIIAQILATF
ncbi:MAG: UDP-N-acetylglucosamine 2-epimerase (non-hydrolyzing) [Armatimonadetes bacterium]|nr:UDP-N-acetylglucosamine 2-epimerase (non-hydrolyzing) [Armatimonadota bacterium]